MSTAELTGAGTAADSGPDGPDLPLAGIRILDFTQVEFGPCATQVLADYGADIIKVERPTVGDISRSTDRFSVDGRGSAYFLSLNRNKRSLAIDLSDPSTRAVIDRLIASVDVLVHNFRPGVAGRLGIDYSTVHALNPSLIYASGSGFGEVGPLVHKAGQDLLAQSLSGVVDANRGGNGNAALYPIALADYSAGMVLAQGILLALVQRARTGRGQEVRTSLLEVMMAMQMQEATQLLLRGRSVNWLNEYLMGTFRTADGEVTFVGVFRANPVQDACRALGVDDLSALPQFATPALQLANRDTLFEQLAPAFAARTTAECLEALDSVDILCAPVLSLQAALDQPQIEELGLLADVPLPAGGSFRTVQTPLHLSESPTLVHRAPPELGADGREILVDAGFSEADIDGLVASGVLQVPEQP